MIDLDAIKKRRGTAGFDLMSDALADMVSVDIQSLEAVYRFAAERHGFPDSRHENCDLCLFLWSVKRTLDAALGEGGGK